ncbi:MAG: hypothetical protein MI864_27240 [Pseudomonadales bacterium]|nr:hypothetical protein [Pseudomonadales bacterium]
MIRIGTIVLLSTIYLTNVSAEVKTLTNEEMSSVDGQIMSNTPKINLVIDNDSDNQQSVFLVSGLLLASQQALADALQSDPNATEAHEQLVADLEEVLNGGLIGDAELGLLFGLSPLSFIPLSRQVGGFEYNPQDISVQGEMTVQFRLDE